VFGVWCQGKCFTDQMTLLNTCETVFNQLFYSGAIDNASKLTRSSANSSYLHGGEGTKHMQEGEPLSTPYVKWFHSLPGLVFKSVAPLTILTNSLPPTLLVQ